ncbi:transporter [Paenibacillus pectinilyticus]|uniref:Transporter n=1 Tax=Paenibacillus pectinilyticus TaxID=512399 RepID=A0A1C0ZY61_9BACL|nr:DMT family transporter [Paenibacillus pectinilyticus]OCT13019.1 transporter [Paenibacillus pectinilyticus]
MQPSGGIKLAYALAVLNAVIIGFSFLFAKIALDYAQPLDTLMYRFAASFLGISIPVVVGLVKLNYRGKPIGKALLLSAMYPLGFFTLQAYGLQHTTAAEAGILYAFTPIVTMICASIFLKEVTNLGQKLSIFCSVFGVVFIFVMKGSGLNISNITGISLLILTCVSFAGYSVMARSLSKQFSPAEISYMMLSTGFGVFLIVSLFTHMTSGTFEAMLTPLSQPLFLVSTLFLGLVSSLVTALSSSYVLSKIAASQMSVFTNLSTIVTIAAGAMFLGEQITVYHIVGSLLIVAGVLGTQYYGGRAEAVPKLSERV